MNFTLHNGDCLELMKDIPDNSIDLILCDLPYGTTACSWDTIIPFDLMWEQLYRIRKNNCPILLFASQPFTTVLINSNFKEFRYELIWEKNSSGGFILAKKQPMKYHENIAVFYKELPTYNPQFGDYSESTKTKFKKSGKINCNKMIDSEFSNEIQCIKRVQDTIELERGSYPKSVLKFKSVTNANGTRVHPTQKPVDLCEYLIKTFSNENDTVLDFTMGSGTTGVACMNTKRNFIGMELDSSYFKIATDRIRESHDIMMTSLEFERNFV